MRADVRDALELRALALLAGELHQASGSARWSQGATSVLAAVYGPALTSKSEADEQATLDISFHLSTIDIGDAEAELKHLLHDSLQTMLILKYFPRCYVRVDIQVLYDDGSLLSCAFNAAFNALMDAGIPMKAQWGALTVAVMEESVVYIDPTKAEEKEAQTVVNAVYPAYRIPEGDGSEMKICIEDAPICCRMQGNVSTEELFSVMEICRHGCEKIVQFNCAAAAKRLKHLQEDK